MAIASNVFWYLAVYFVFPISIFWLSSPSTLVRNSFLAGPAFLASLLEHEVCHQLPSFDLFSSDHVEKLVGAL